MKMPNYVRLPIHLRGRYDMVSGWGISGLDVKQVPDAEEEPNAFAFIQREVSAGRLEGASRAEYDEVHKDIVDPDAEYNEDSPYQERSVRQAAAVQHGKIRKARQGEADVTAADADEERRKSILKAQKKKDKKSKSKKDDESDSADLDGNPAATPEGDESEEADEYAGMDISALRGIAKERELSAGGGAEDIRKRLREADASTE